MANLLVRNVDDSIIDALKAQARKHGISTEAEHRRILAQALKLPKKKTFVSVVSEMPDVGKDADFERVDDCCLGQGVWR